MVEDAGAAPSLPWDVVETLPSTDEALIGFWDDHVASSDDPAARAHALVGRALASYWAVQERALVRTWQEVADQRLADTDEAVAIARRVGDPTLLAQSLLGGIYARWGPDHLEARAASLEELSRLDPDVADLEVRLRSRAQQVVACFDHGDLDGARLLMDRYAEVAGADHALAQRRFRLWQANVAMLEGRIDEALTLNEAAVSETAGTAGSPFSFQNVAITLAIERFLRRGLDDLIDAIESIRASSDRVGANWDTGLAFALAETGQLDRSREIFERVAPDDFGAVHRDLNWLVTMQLLGLVALRLDDRPRCGELLAHLSPYAHLDAIHGAAYASYGPVGRVVGSLAARVGDTETAAACFADVLSTREPGPWTALARLDRAIALADVDPESARQSAERAVRDLRGLGLSGWALAAEATRDRLDLDGQGPPVALRDAERWHLRHATGAATVDLGVGMAYLTTLLAAPGRTFDVTALDTLIDQSLPATGAARDDLDPEARRAYRRRLQELTAEGIERPPSVEREIAFLRRELAGAAFAPSASPELERARVRVTKALRRAVDAIESQSAELAQHLRVSIETGRQCTYAPGDGAAWRVGDLISAE